MPAIIFLWMMSLGITAPTQDVKEAQISIKALIRPLIPGQNKTLPKEVKDFRVDLCEKHKVNWMNVLLMRETVTLEYKFKEGCDIQGTITPKVFTPFPSKLALKNLKSYEEIETQNKVTASIETKPLMFLEMREGKLKGKKGIVKFEADYQVRLDPMKKKDVVEENLGGEIRILEIHGKKVSIKEKIKVE